MSDWSLVYQGYEPEQEGRRETLCALGNGYFVTRAAAPDGVADGVHYPGTYLAGGYNRLRTEIAGRTIENEDLVNLPNWLPLVLRIEDGDWLRPDDVEMLDYRQEPDLRQGLLLRAVRFRDRAGRTTRWDERRFVSMQDRHVAGLAVTVTPEDWSGRLAVRSALDGTVINDGVPRYRPLSSRHLETITTARPESDVIFIRSRMVQSRREIAEAARTRLYLAEQAVAPPRETEQLADLAAQEMTVEIKAGQPLLIEKLVALYTSSDPAIAEAGLEACQKVCELGRFEELFNAHRLAWQHLWEESDLRIGTAADAGVVATLRLHIFHLLQTVSDHTIDLDVGVPPRGWPGEAYRGHILWDELFIFPFLNLRLPALTGPFCATATGACPKRGERLRQPATGAPCFPGRAGATAARRPREFA